MRVKLFIEGGGPTRKIQAPLREGFSRLFQNCGFAGHMPECIPCGSRKEAYDDFVHAFTKAKPDEFIALLVDSEDPVVDIKKPWDHLKKRKDDQWVKPAEATDEHALLMVTCMETWIIGARESLVSCYDSSFQVDALPEVNLESRNRHDIQKILAHATRDCKTPYDKSQRTFTILGKLEPDELRKLPSFLRCECILRDKLKLQPLPDCP